MSLSASDTAKFQDLCFRFQATKEAFAQARTLEEKREIMAVAWEVIRQAKEQVKQLKSDIQRMKEQ